MLLLLIILQILSGLISMLVMFYVDSKSESEITYLAEEDSPGIIKFGVLGVFYLPFAFEALHKLQNELKIKNKAKNKVKTT